MSLRWRTDHPMSNRFIGYVRVSTQKQKDSGLGLSAQRDAINQFVAGRQGELLYIAEEVESGKVNTRPALLEALLKAKRYDATLVIAKLDRLSRNVYFLAKLMEERARFVACDMPDANELTIHVMAALAQAERKAISSRTKAALKVYKDQGRVGKRVVEHYKGEVPPDVLEQRAGKLGSTLVGSHLQESHRTKGRTLGNAEQRRQSLAIYGDLVEEIKELRRNQYTLRGIAALLNARHERTRNFKPISHVLVKRLLDRSKLIESHHP